METKRIVKDYLDGKIKNPTELAKLYNDYSFMTNLLKQTKDVKYYYLSSHDLKTNIDYVIFLTDIFDNDLNLMFSIINNMYYSIVISEKDPKFVKLLAIIDSYMRDREFEFDVVYQMQYRQKIICLFDEFQNEVDNALELYKNIDYSKHHFGFRLAETTYYNDEYIVKFFARHFLDKIFYGFDFEDFIHKKSIDFDKKTDLFKKKVLAHYVKRFDNSLYYYVLKHQDLLEEKICLLNQVIDNYDDYSSDNVEEKIVKFNDKVNTYIKDENIKKAFNIEVIKYEEIKRLGLEVEFYGKELDYIIKYNKKGVVNYEEEKFRLFVRTELQNLFKNKARKLALTNKKED